LEMAQIDRPYDTSYYWCVVTTCSSKDMIVDRHTHRDRRTDRKTDMLITILCSHIGGIVIISYWLDK